MADLKEDIKNVFCYFSYGDDVVALAHSIKSIRYLSGVGNLGNYKIVVYVDSKNPLPCWYDNMVEVDLLIHTTFDRNGALRGEKCLASMLKSIKKLSKIWNIENIIKINSDVLFKGCEFFQSANAKKFTFWTYENEKKDILRICGSFYSFKLNVINKVLRFLKDNVGKYDMNENSSFIFGDILQKTLKKEECLPRFSCENGDYFVFAYSMVSSQKYFVQEFENSEAVLFDYKILTHYEKYDEKNAKRYTHFRMKEYYDYKLKRKTGDNGIDVVFAIMTHSNDYNSLKECVRSIKTNFSLYNYRIVICDDIKSKIPYELIENIDCDMYEITPFNRNRNLNGMEYCIGAVKLYKRLFKFYDCKTLIKLDSDCIVRDSAVMSLMDNNNSVFSGFRRYDSIDKLKDFSVYGATMMFKEECLNSSLSNLKNIDSFEINPHIRKYYGEDFTISWSISKDYRERTAVFNWDYEDVNNNENPRYNGIMGLGWYCYGDSPEADKDSFEIFNNYDVIHFGNPVNYEGDYVKSRAIQCEWMKKYADHYGYLN